MSLNSNGRSRDAAFALGGLFVLTVSVSALFSSLKDYFSVSADEAIVGHWASLLLKGGAPPPMSQAHFVVVWGRALPLDFNFYKGPWEFYTTAPFLLAAQDPWLGLRLHAAFWMLCAAAASYLLVGTITGWASPLPLACGLAAAVSKGFVEASLSGVELGGAPVAALGALAFSLLLLASRGSKPAWLLGCLAAGLAPGFAPQGAAVLLAWLGGAFTLRESLRKAAAGRALASAALLFVGLSPMLLSNILFGGYAARGAARALAATEYGVRNADYAANLWTRMVQLESVLGFRRSPWAWILLLAAVAAARRTAGRGEPDAAARVIAPALLCILLVSPFTLGALRHEHLWILLPLTLALPAAVYAGRRRPRRERAGLILGLALVPMIAGGLMDLRLLERRHELSVPAEWTLRRGVKRVLVLGHHIEHALRYRQLWGKTAASPAIASSGCAGGAWRGAAEAWLAEGPGLVLVEGMCPRQEAAELLKRAAKRRGWNFDDVTRELYPSEPSPIAFYSLAPPNMDFASNLAAANRGDAKAQHRLGLLYRDGRGVGRDLERAGRWFRKAAEQGFAEAQYELGMRYLMGQGVARDDAEAESWLRKAAKQGDTSAQYNLRVMKTRSPAASAP